MTILPLWIFALLLSGCGQAIEATNPSSTASNPASPSLSIQGPTQLVSGSTTTFRAVSNQDTQPDVTWEIDGITGGSATVGLISSYGSYTAPETTQAVTLRCSGTAPPALSATLIIHIVPAPPPVILSGDAIQTNDGTFVVDILGQGFSSQSAILLNGIPSPTTWLSATQLRTSLQQTHISNTTIEAVVSNPFPHAVASNTMVIEIPENRTANVSFPPPFQDQVGCENPNSGTSTGNWGPANANYITVTDNSPLIGTPEYTSNHIFWISQEAAPGQSILMSGAFTPTRKTARIALIPPGTQDWQTLVEQSPTHIPTTQIGTTGLSLSVPSSFQAGVYGFELDDPSAPSVSSLVNAPSVQWSIGIPFTSDPALALQHHVYHCGAEAGEVLRLFGRNFSPGEKVVLESPDGHAYPLAPSFVDATSISASLPRTLPAGTYVAWVGNSSWDATSSEPFLLTVVTSPPPVVNIFPCSSLIGDGQSDNTALLQACLDRFAPETGSNQINYITIAAGSFLLTGGITFHPYEVLLGSSPASTQFIGGSRSSRPQTWMIVPDHVGLANFSFIAPVNPNLLASSSVAGSTFIDHVEFRVTTDYSNGDERNVYLSGPDLQIYNSTFQTTPNPANPYKPVNILLDHGDGAVVSGNTFIDNGSYSEVVDSQNADIENNISYSQDGPGMSGGAAWGIAREFVPYYPSQVTRNVYIGYNIFHDMGMPGNAVITTDGGAGAYVGYVAASTDDTVTLADDPSWIWTGYSYPKAAAIEIVSGTGVGQFSLVKSIKGRTIEVTMPWKVTPDTSSIVQITDPKINLTISHNTFTDIAGFAFELFGTGVDSVIEDNVLNDAGQGLQVFAFGPYKRSIPENYLSTFDTEVYRNTLSVGSGEWITDATGSAVGGLSIGDMPGCDVSGLVMRQNVVPYDQAIQVVNGRNGTNAILIEQNEANILFQSRLTEEWGFLVQDNQAVPPPSSP